jgi:hypothetical protein
MEYNNDSSHKSNDFDYNWIQFNSFQYSSVLIYSCANLTAQRPITEWVWVKKTDKIHKQNIKTYNSYYLNNNNSINTNQSYHCEVKNNIYTFRMNIISSKCNEWKTMPTIKCDSKKQVEAFNTWIYNNITSIQFLIYLHAYTTDQTSIIKQAKT